MIDKLAIIKQILETDEETDKKILSLLETAEQSTKPDTTKIHIEIRESKRKEVQMDADINTGKERIHADVKDISLSGAFIMTEKKIAKGEDIAIRMSTSSGDEFAFVAEVASVHADGVGVFVKTISKIHKDRYHKFVNSL